MKATRNGKLEAVKRLLAAGCSVSVRDRNSDTALHFAARHGNARLLSALITASSADINMQVSLLKPRKYLWTSSPTSDRNKSQD